MNAKDGGRLGGVLSVAAVVVVASLLGLMLAGRAFRAPPAALAAAVTFLPYLFLASCVPLLLAWLAAPRRLVLPLSLGLVGAAGLGLWGPRWEGRAVDGGAPVRVMSWNLRRLWGGPDDGGDPMACATEAIEAADPDVLTLLEVSAVDVSLLARRLGL